MVLFIVNSESTRHCHSNFKSFELQNYIMALSAPLQSTGHKFESFTSFVEISSTIHYLMLKIKQ